MLGNPRQVKSNGVTLIFTDADELVGMIYKTDKDQWLTRRVVCGFAKWAWLEKAFISEEEALAFLKREVIEGACWFSG